MTLGGLLVVRSGSSGVEYMFRVRSLAPGFLYWLAEGICCVPQSASMHMLLAHALLQCEFWLSKKDCSKEPKDSLKADSMAILSSLLPYCRRRCLVIRCASSWYGHA